MALNCSTNLRPVQRRVPLCTPGCGRGLQGNRFGLVGLAATVATSLLFFPPQVSAQELSLADVMRRAHEFVVEYEDDLSTVVAEEHYEQRVLREDGGVEQQRVLVSDYSVTQLLPYEGWIGVRDVFEVDGTVVSDRAHGSSPPLRLSPGEDGNARLTQIAENNARYNLGDVIRTVNDPTFVLAFLRPYNRDRVRFSALGEEQIGTLPTWVVGYREVPVDGMSFIETQDGGHLLARGRLWIDPENGHLVRSELITGDARVELTARVTVDYGWFPTVNLWLPAEMHEVYETTGPVRGSPVITGTATYSNYRILTPALGSLTVAWDPSRDPDIVGYIVEWGETPGSHKHATDVGKVNRFKIDSLVEGQRYYVIVRSYTAARHTSIASDEASGLATVGRE